MMLSLCLDTLITDELNNMQYLSNARTFQNFFHVQETCKLCNICKLKITTILSNKSFIGLSYFFVLNFV